MTPATLHFLVGPTGAGKTTDAIRFCEEVGAVHFSIDEWMTALFWKDAPKPLNFKWTMERVERCTTQIWETAARVAELGVPCMLEIGFGSRSTRQKYSALATEAGLSVQFHLLEVLKDERWRRVQARNLEVGGPVQLGFAITRQMFDFTESFWDPPTEKEMADHTGVRVSA